MYLKVLEISSSRGTVCLYAFDIYDINIVSALSGPTTAPPTWTPPPPPPATPTTTPPPTMSPSTRRSYPGTRTAPASPDQVRWGLWGHLDRAFHFWHYYSRKVVSTRGSFCSVKAISNKWCPYSTYKLKKAASFSPKISMSKWPNSNNLDSEGNYKSFLFNLCRNFHKIWLPLNLHLVHRIRVWGRRRVELVWPQSVLQILHLRQRYRHGRADQKLFWKIL